MSIRLSCLVIIATCPALFGVQAAELYVSTAGNDAFPGTIERLYRTIQHAADAAKPGETVLVRGGINPNWLRAACVDMVPVRGRPAPMTFMSRHLVHD
ncbi:MAG TPA: hypothetical protein VMW24_24475 [Sedimentisphaerales bacterium]|nr:hypothetical protein [Sedimentisphaerales bacterium]